jgi:hypothetical protein
MSAKVVLLMAGLALAPDAPPPAGMAKPEYTSNGELKRPENTEGWVFVGSAIGLSYNQDLQREGPGLIHNVQMQPEAFQHFRQTGQFPDKTIFVLRLYKPEQKVSPNLHGYFQGELVATEVAVKDVTRFAERWAYFDFGKDRRTASAQPRERCHSCHAKHGAQDNVFVQFYPVLRERIATR